jgi:hypothetical protein
MNTQRVRSLCHSPLMAAPPLDRRSLPWVTADAMTPGDMGRMVKRRMSDFVTNGFRSFRRPKSVAYHVTISKFCKPNYL